MRLFENHQIQPIIYPYLPEDIVFTIASFLPVSDKLVLAKVCKTWRLAVLKDTEYCTLLQLIGKKIQLGNQKLIKILSSPSERIPHPIAYPKWGGHMGYMSYDFKYDTLEVSVFENNRQRAKRLKPSIDQLGYEIALQVKKITGIPCRVINRDTEFVLSFKKEKEYSELDTTVDSLGVLFRSVLAGFVSCLSC